MTEGQVFRLMELYNVRLVSKPPRPAARPSGGSRGSP